MSSSLYWEPVVEAERYLGYQLKFVLRIKYDNPIDKTFTNKDIPFLEGVFISAQKETAREAKKLIALIEKHGSVLVKEVF